MITAAILDIENNSLIVKIPALVTVLHNFNPQFFLYESKLLLGFEKILV